MTAKKVIDNKPSFVDKVFVVAHGNYRKENEQWVFNQIISEEPWAGVDNGRTVTEAEAKAEFLRLYYCGMNEQSNDLLAGQIGAQIALECGITTYQRPSTETIVGSRLPGNIAMTFPTSGPVWGRRSALALSL